MTRTQYVNAGGIFGVCAATVLAGALFSAPRVLAHDDDKDGDEAKVRRGLAIAPVHLNLAHKNRHLVGLGSYIVNAQGDCNGCHSAGPQTEFAPGGEGSFSVELAGPGRHNGRCRPGCHQLGRRLFSRPAAGRFDARNSWSRPSSRSRCSRCDPR